MGLLAIVVNSELSPFGSVRGQLTLKLELLDSVPRQQSKIERNCGVFVVKNV
jgi:hypothetical protein